MTDNATSPDTGPLSEADVLASIGGWRIGCEIEQENRYIVSKCDAAGYLAIRKHYAPVTPEGDPAWQLTDIGLRRLATIGTSEQFCDAINMRDWYRANASKPAAPQSPDLREALDEAWKLLDIAYSVHQKLGFEGQGARYLLHETRMFAAEFSKPEEPKTPEHTILSGTGRYQKWREQTKAALAAPSPVLPPSGPIPKGMKPIYVKRWRTLILVGESIADEVRAALSASVVGEENETYRETVRRVAAAREKGYAAARANLQEAWAALALIRETVETLGPVGAMKASEHLDGPTFMHEAEEIISGIRALSASVAQEAAGAMCVSKAYGGEWCIGRCLDPKDCSTFPAAPSPVLDPGTVEACARIVESRMVWWPNSADARIADGSENAFIARQIRALASPAPGNADRERP